MRISDFFLAIALLSNQPLLESALPVGTFEQVDTYSVDSATRLNYSPLIAGNVFLGVANCSSPGFVSSFFVDQITGALSEVAGSPFPAGGTPNWVAFSPILAGKLFSAAPNQGSNDISVYSVNPLTGVYTEVAGSPFAAGAYPTCIAYTPLLAGNVFAVCANVNSPSISIYAVNQITGAFLAVPSSPVATPGSAAIAVTPIVGGKVFVINASIGTNTVTVYELNALTGALTEVAGSPFPTGTAPGGLAVSSIVAGNVFVAVPNRVSDNVSVYTLNQSTGALVQVPGSPFPAGDSPDQVAFSPVVSGYLFAAVTNALSGNVSVFRVNQTTGVFTEVVGSPFATSTAPQGISFSPDLEGNLFAAVAGQGLVTIFQVALEVDLFPPSNFIGVIRKNKFLNRTDCVLETTWISSPTENVTSYRIKKDGVVIAEVLATAPLVFSTCLRRCSAEGYSIVAVNSNGEESLPVALVIAE